MVMCLWKISRKKSRNMLVLADVREIARKIAGYLVVLAEKDFLERRKCLRGKMGLGQCIAAG